MAGANAGLSARRARGILCRLPGGATWRHSTANEPPRCTANCTRHLPSDPALRVKTLESLAVERGLVAPESIDAWIEAYSEHIGPKRGAKVVARAWTDPGFRERLLDDAAEAIKEFGFQGSATGHLKAVENTDDQHNLVVCTLCSCYPFSILGMSPAWYKSAEYRARAVREPRKVLAEFGVTLPDHVGVRVWDSTAELRYIVIPQRPAGTEGWDEDAPRRHRHAQLDDRHRARPEDGAGLMDGIHDLGGMQGFGPVPVKTGDAPFPRHRRTGKSACGALARNAPRARDHHRLVPPRARAHGARPTTCASPTSTSGAPTT